MRYLPLKYNLLQSVSRCILQADAPPKRQEIEPPVPIPRRSITTAATLTEQALSLIHTPSVGLAVNGCGPAAALIALDHAVPLGAELWKDWMQNARIDAVLGSCPLSRNSFRSGLRNWIKFVQIASRGNASPFPLVLDHIIAWSHTFRCVATYSNYLGYVRSACLALGVEGPPCGHPAITRAKAAVVKRILFTPRPRMFIQGYLIRQLIVDSEKRQREQNMAMLWLAAYTFLLRVPSEALPMAKGDAVTSEWPGNEQSVLFLQDENTLCLKLLRRKNMMRGTVIKRTCSCRNSVRLCPIHVLWHGFFAGLDFGAKPWARLSSGFANRSLRQALTELKVPHAVSYGTHDIRRGHAKDLQMSGASLAETLAAGQWRSPAFMKYLDQSELEQGVALEAAVESDDDEWIN
jgi:hypothetical protein